MHEDVYNKTLVLLVGQPKAGTTSLFYWLSQHPKIGSGKLKELRFFLDPHYPLQSPLRFDGSNLHEYLSLFNNSERPVLLDASPDYIGCNAPLRLPSIHADVKAIIILRDPVERMISAYRFFQSRGMIPSNMSFDGFVAKQHTEGVTATTEVQYRALDHCRTEHYLRLWRAAYGNNLLVLDFEDIRCYPVAVVGKICDFIGLERMDFVEMAHKNKTQSYRYPKLYGMYCGVRDWWALKTLGCPKIYKFLRPAGRILLKVLPSSQGEALEVQFSQKTLSIIQDCIRH